MLNAQNLHLAYGSRVILDDVSLTLLPKERLALVGQNGAGKSSLLSALFNQEVDGGVIELSKNATIGYLMQVPKLDKELSVLETVRLGLEEHICFIKEHAVLCEELAHADEALAAKLHKKIETLAHYIEQHGGFDVDYRIDVVLSRLGVKNRDQKIATLSGGERRRVDLARILLMSPDIYLLDEPTNHLDVPAIEFLVETFTKSSAAILFVSHDRSFIDEMATRIVELERGKIFFHEPPFANYLENKIVRELIEERSLHRRERLMVNELAWLRSGTPARTTKQNARIDRAHELMNQIAKDTETQRKKNLDLLLAKEKRLGNTIMELDNIGAKIGERVLFKDFSLKVGPRQRYGILGPNGIGKTTLLSIIGKKIEPSFGKVEYGKNTSVIEFDQHREVLNPDATLKETLADFGDYVHIDNQKIHIASYLERYLFDGSDANRKVSALSGGEQNRLMLAKLFRHNANCLLMDEPTNDLDVSSLAILEEFLLEYVGVIFTVSHDRKFLDRICTHIIAFEPHDDPKVMEHKLTVYTGNFSDYQRQKEKYGQKQAVATSEKSEEKIRVRTRAKKRSFKEEQELSQIEPLILSLEAEKEVISKELLDPAIYKDHQIATEKTERLNVLEREIERLYGRWQELLDLDN